jgi:hypothetical protein
MVSGSDKSARSTGKVSLTVLRLSMAVPTFNFTKHTKAQGTQWNFTTPDSIKTAPRNMEITGGNACMPPNRV